MPFPAQVDRQKIVEKARALIEADGPEHLSLGKLAGALGIKAPSLYHHFSSKTALLRSINEATAVALVAALRAAGEAAGDGSRAQLTAMLHAYRSFAHAHPATYGLAFTTTVAELRFDAVQGEQLAFPLQALMAKLVGEPAALAALRGAMALAHGFVMLELAGQFRRGGNLDEAFAQAVEAYLKGW